MATKLVTINEVVAEAASVIRGATDQERHLMRQWAFSGNNEIGFSKLDIKVSGELSLTDYSVAKPTDHVRTIDLALYTEDDEEVRVNFKGSGLVSGNEIARVHEDLRGIVYQVNVTEDNDYFNVEDFNDTAGYIKVKYYAIKLDSSDLPLIAASSKLAIMMYVRYMWDLRNNQPPVVLRESERRWRVARAAAESKLKTPDVMEGAEIAKKINSLIQKPFLRYRRF